MTSAYAAHTVPLHLPFCLSLSLSSHLHIHFDPQLFVYFWDCLIRGQMCRLWLAAAEACGVGEQQSDGGEGGLICPPVGCNQAAKKKRREALLVRLGPMLSGVSTNGPILELCMRACGC